MRNKNDILPDTSLWKVFTEFYKLKKGLDDHPDDETYTDHATIILVTIVENMFRVMMLPKMSCLKPSKRIGLSVPLLMNMMRESDRGWTLPGQDLEKVVRDALKPIGECGSGDLVWLRVGDVDRFIDTACPRPRPYLKNTILASSYPFQNVGCIKLEFGEGVFENTGHCEPDYEKMFDARHALVHSLLREPQPKVGRLVLGRVRMVENLFRKLLEGMPGTFDHYKGVALVDTDPGTAIRHLEAAARQANPDWWLHYHLGLAHLKVGSRENAKTAFLEACRKIGGLRKEMEGRRAQADAAASDWMREDMAVLAVSLGAEMTSLDEDDAASECFDCAVSISGEAYPGMCAGAAWYQWGISRFEKAAEYLDVALRSRDLAAGKRAMLYVDKGFMLQLLGSEGEAKACFEEALKLDPSNESACKHLSEQRA